MHNTELSLVCRVLGQSSRQFDAIRPTLISSNKHSLSSKAAPCQPPWYWVQHVPSSWGCPLEPPPQPTSQQLRSAHYTWSSQTESLQPLLLKHRKFVWYFRLIHWNKDHNNAKSISYLSSFLEPSSCTVVPWSPFLKCMLQWTYLLPGEQPQPTKMLRTHRNMAKMKFCIILGEKKICTLQWKPRRGMRDEFLQANLRAITHLPDMVKLSLVSRHIFCLFILTREVFSCHYPATF